MNPHYNHGCGSTYCPLCAPGIEREIARSHQAMVDRSVPGVAIQSEWRAEAYGTGAPRGPAKVDRAYVRGQQREAKERERIKRVVSNAHRNELQGTMNATFERSKTFDVRIDPSELVAEAWAELLNPSVLVAEREAHASWDVRVRKAIDRARAVLGKFYQESDSYDSLEGLA